MDAIAPLLNDAAGRPAAVGQLCADRSIRDELALRVQALGLIGADARWRRLRGGRSNCVWRATDGRRDIVAKLYDPHAASPLFRNDPAAERAALDLMAPLGLAPLPLASIDTARGPCLIYRTAPGPAWRRGVAGVARLLGAVHAAAPDPRLPHLPHGAAAVADQTRAMLAQIGGHDARAARIRAALAADGAGPLTDPRPVHGDPVAGNIIAAPGGPVLIDWQCPGLGDPCADIATFLSPAMQLLYRGRLLTAGEVRAFLQAYPDRAMIARHHDLRHGLHLRIAAHCLWKVARGDPAYLQALDAELAGLGLSEG